MIRKVKLLILEILLATLLLFYVLYFDEWENAVTGFVILSNLFLGLLLSFGNAKKSKKLPLYLSFIGAFWIICYFLVVYRLGKIFDVSQWKIIIFDEKLAVFVWLFFICTFVLLHFNDNSLDAKENDLTCN